MPEADAALRPPSVPLTALSGFLMGSADAVPGVSGGTVALLLGLYERLVAATSSALRLPFLVRSATGRRELGTAFRFLLPLLVGLLAAYWLGTRLLVGPADAPGLLRRVETAPLCYAFFAGLVLFSLWEPWRRIASPGLSHVLLLLAGAAAAAWLAGLPHAQGEVSRGALVYGGALAVAVMLLPGVSGSLLLVVLGQYTVVAGAVHDRDVGVLAVFFLGVLIGLASFVPLLKLLLARVHDPTMALLTGLMAGSLRALWPWKSNYDLKAGPMTNTGIGDGVALAALCLLAGGLGAWGLARLERRLQPRDA